jgi:mono/diheme cytochrome c family protein
MDMNIGGMRVRYQLSPVSVRAVAGHLCCWAAGVVWCALSSGPLYADGPPADPAVARGESIARNVCSACHIVASDQQPRHLPAEAPSFSAIANRPETNEKALRRFIATTHWDMKSMPLTMPSPMLTNEQIRDVARYILTLRSAKPGGSAPAG